MAGAAVGSRKCRSGRLVYRIRRPQIIRHVAGRARRGKSQIISDRCILVAFLAFHNGVRAQQREPVEVVLNRLVRNLPAKGRVALGAIGAKLPTVNIGMATGAVLADVGEHWLGVAARAGHFFVHASKGVSRGVMIEFGNSANRSPAGVGMAILACNVQGTVRTPFGLLLRGGCAANRKNQSNKSQQPQDL